MEKKYYKFGLRPIFSEEATNGIIRFYAFQWDTGSFKEDMTYLLKMKAPKYCIVGNSPERIVKTYEGQK
jgi:hypothetical protein